VLHVEADRLFQIVNFLLGTFQDVQDNLRKLIVERHHVAARIFAGKADRLNARFDTAIAEDVTTVGDEELAALRLQGYIESTVTAI